MRKLSSEKDTLLNLNYDLVIANAKKLSELLKKNISSLGVNLTDFNSEADGSSVRYNEEKIFKAVLVNPPAEIYEYQNFVLFERADGVMVLLDGFRRLLWYNTPDMNVYCRVYKAADMSNEQILQLLVYLNHTKFFSGIGDYYDRGFALSLNLAFGMDILKYKKVFNAYLSSDTLRRGYSDFNKKERQVKNNEVKLRIVNQHFIDDMLFVQKLVGNDVMLNSNFGVLTYNFRKENPSTKFDADLFLKRCKENKLIKEGFVKFTKAGDTDSSKAQEGVNRLIELYTNIFNEMIGAEKNETYVELNEKAKAITAELKKDKTLTKWSDSKSYNKIESDIIDFLNKNNGKSPKFKVVVFPVEKNSYSFSNDKTLLEVGQYDDFEIKSIKTYKKWSGSEYVFVITNPKNTIGINFKILMDNFTFYGRLPNRIETTDYENRDKFNSPEIDLFIDLNNAGESKVVFEPIKEK